MIENTIPLPADKPAPIFSIGAGVLRNARTAWRCHIGRRLRKAREYHRGLNTADKLVTGRGQLGEAVGLSQRAVWEIENGLAPLDVADLALFAEALGVHPGSFFDEKDFIPRASAVASILPYASVARTLGELGETERDIVIQLILFLAGRHTHTQNQSERRPGPTAVQGRSRWA